MIIKRRAESDGGLRRIMREHLPHIHWTTVETGALSPGTPDCEGCWKKVQWWIENKFTTGYAIKFQPLQIGWLERRRRAGGNAYVAVRRSASEGIRKGAAVDEFWLFDGKDAGELARGGLTAVRPLARWAGGPPGWDWRGLERLLVRPLPDVRATR